MYNLKEKYGEWALVTGASSGIGEEFARVLASENINLVLTARRMDRLNSLADMLKKEYQIRVINIEADLFQDNSIDKIIEQTAGLEIGILINNAGAGNFGAFENFDLDKELDMLRLNCIAPVILAHHFIRHMTEQKRGAVIFVGSIVGTVPNPGMSLYSASKAFNNSLGPALWYDQKKNNIDVLTIAPGGTKTEFHNKAKIKQGPFILPPKHVVNTALKALGKKPFVVDGFVNKATYILSRLLPLRFVMLASGTISEKRKKHL